MLYVLHVLRGLKNYKYKYKIDTLTVYDSIKQI